MKELNLMSQCIIASLLVWVNTTYAQSNRLESSSVVHSAYVGNEQELVQPVFPVFTQTGDPRLDETKFLEMVKAWNLKFPEHHLNEESLTKLRSGQFSQREILQTIEKEKSSLKQKEPIALQYMNQHNIGSLWEFPGLPAAPASDSSEEAFKEWIDLCYKWVTSSPEAQAKLKGVSYLPEYPFRNNPTLDPEYPVYKNTGNTERDAEEYHAQKLRYTAKMSNYRN
jgi:hypothetical protein